MKIRALLAAAAALGTMSVAQNASATNYTLYLHGMSLFAGCGNTPSTWCYWGGGQPGVNAVPVNYDGTAHASTQLPTIKNALDAYCMGSNTCYVSAHSAGGMMIGYAEAVYPGRWNINWVMIGGGAQGGSELANAADWAIPSQTMNAVCGMCSDLTTGNARSLYNHDSLGDYISGYVYPSMGGNWSTWDTCFFPGGGWACPNGVGSGGGNDRVVAYHSSGNFRNVGNYGSGNANWSTSHDTSYYDWTITWFSDNESSGNETHFTIMNNYVAPAMRSYAQ